MTTKHKILAGIARHGGIVGNAKDLRLAANTDIHNLVHILHRLRKDGYIAFRENKKGAITIPTDIQLTPKGRQLHEDNP